MKKCKWCNDIIYNSKDYIELCDYCLKNKNIDLNNIEKHNKKQKSLNPTLIFKRLKNNTKNRDILFNINEKEFIVWFNNQKLKCSYCDIIFTEDNFKTWFSLSIDRIDNNIGYQLDNICLSCRKCNQIKSNFFNNEQMIQIGKFLKNNIYKDSGILFNNIIPKDLSIWK